MNLAEIQDAMSRTWDSAKTRKHLGVDSRTLQRYVAEEQLASVLIGRSRRFEPTEVRKFKKVVDARKRAIQPKNNGS